jgi:hypothetical protein
MDAAWAGDATISVTLNLVRGSTQSREMHAANRITNLHMSYTITLTALAPYPRSSRKFRPPLWSRRLSSL